MKSIIAIILILATIGCARVDPFSPRQNRLQRIEAREQSQVQVEERSPQQSYVREAPQGELHQSPITQQDGVHTNIDTTPIILVALFVCATIVLLVWLVAYYYAAHKKDEEIIKELKHR